MRAAPRLRPDSQDRPERVLVLGGGMAGLAAAYELTSPSLGANRREVTVIQPGWRLGGKGASGRGTNDRIEEHGLHVWFGFYQNAFTLLDECYEASRTEERRFQHLDDAFSPADQLGLVEPRSWGGSQDTPSSFRTECFPLPCASPTPLGGPGWQSARGRCDLRRLPMHIVRLLLAIGRGAGGPGDDRDEYPVQSPMIDAVRAAAGVYDPSLPQVHEGIGAGELIGVIDASLAGAAPGAEVGPPLELMMAAADSLAALDEIESATPDPGAFLLPGLPAGVGHLSAMIVALTALCNFGPRDDPSAPFDVLNEIDFREALSGQILRPAPDRRAWDTISWVARWIPRRLMCSRSTIDGAVIRALYDLAFAYRDGDRTQPDVAAGVAVENVINILLGHPGTLMWKMNAGMGDVVFAPIYEALCERKGFALKFFSAVERIEVDDGAVSRITIRHQLGSGSLRDSAYDPSSPDPLVDVGGVPCWPSAPKPENLKVGPESIAPAAEDGDDPARGFERESNPLGLDDEESLEVLKRGEHFDRVVLAMPPAAIEAMTRDRQSDLLNRSPVLHQALVGAHPVATQSLQVWFQRSRGPGGANPLGWPCRAGGRSSVVGGYCKQFGSASCGPPSSPELFDTYCDMDHLLEAEGWPEADEAHLAYFCRVTKLTASERSAPAPLRGLGADRRARDEAVAFLERHFSLPGTDRPYWQLALNGPEALRGAPPGNASWLLPGALYWRCNSSPTERYSTSHAGTVNERLKTDGLRAGPEGITNLYLAGDWIYTAVNAGSIEAATISGMAAAHALEPRCREPILPCWRRT